MTVHLHRSLLLLTSPLPHSPPSELLSTTRQLLRQGGEVYGYCLDDAVEMAAEPQLQGLVKDGLKLFACAYGAQRRDLPLGGSVTWSGLAMLSELIARCDSILVPNPAPLPTETTLLCLGSAPQSPTDSKIANGAAASRKQSMRRVIVSVSADPHTSHRCAEAVRVAAGLAAWQEVRVTLYLGGAAPLVLSEDTSAMRDGDQLRLQVPLLARNGVKVLVDATTPHLGSVASQWCHRPTPAAQDLRQDGAIRL